MRFQIGIPAGGAFLEVMNWYDGFIIDEVWVRFSRFWDIPELEEMDYVQS